MKKFLFSFLSFSLILSCAYADCNSCKNTVAPNCKNEKQECQNVEQSCEKNDCFIEDDEYCTYNQCYFDKRYRNLKTTLCLTSKQETCMDTLYKSFKSDMEILHSRYKNQKNKILEAIECQNDCYKEYADELKEIKKDMKERCKTFDSDIKELLCKKQIKKYKKFKNEEKKKMKKINKYSAIHKFPCCRTMDKCAK